MGCYLCEHRGVDRPREDLGTCSRCSVRVCSAHSTRYGRLQCAICAPGTAAAQAIAGVAIDTDAATAMARIAGSRLPDGQLPRARHALARVSDDRLRLLLRPRPIELVGRPNVVADLGGAIRAHTHGQVTSVPDGRGPAIPLEVLSAAVREAFAEIDPVEPDAITDDAVIVAGGALVMALAVAHEPGASAIPPPWEMTHPALLDPVIWALATAYELG